MPKVENVVFPRKFSTFHSHHLFYNHCHLTGKKKTFPIAFSTPKYKYKFEMKNAKKKKEKHNQTFHCSRDVREMFFYFQFQS